MANKGQKWGVSIHDTLENLQNSGKAFILYVLSAILIMCAICVAVFFSFVKGEEEVLVPSVVGKDLTEALMEMQVKELYPKLLLRYSDNPEDKNKILEQSPKEGSIVKAGKRITLIVSRGPSISNVENFIGWTYDDVKTHLKTLFTSTSKTLIKIADPLYEDNSAPPGTVLQQDPAPDTEIVDTVTLQLVVSSGPGSEKISVPLITGFSLSDMYVQMQTEGFVYDFAVSPEQTEERTPVIVSQDPAPDTAVGPNTHIAAVIAFPAPKGFNPPVYGLYSYPLAEYPFLMDITLEAVPPSGKSYKIASFKHPGGNLTIPYAVPKNTVLVLSVQGNEIAQYIVQGSE